MMDTQREMFFECSCTEEGAGVGKAIFAGGFKFAASEAMK